MNKKSITNCMKNLGKNWQLIQNYKQHLNENSCKILYRSNSKYFLNQLFSIFKTSINKDKR